MFKKQLLRETIPSNEYSKHLKLTVTMFINAPEFPYPNAKAEVTNKLIKDSKRHSFGF